MKGGRTGILMAVGELEKNEGKRYLFLASIQYIRALLN